MNLAKHYAVQNYVGRNLILDSNLLLLLWCAQLDRKLVDTFKRLNGFALPDVQLLEQLLPLFRSIHTTPHVLTEVSNLANSLPDWRKQDWAQFFSGKVLTLHEKWIQADVIVKDNKEAMPLGLTDAALVNLSGSYVILTADRKLAVEIEKRGLAVINFNHIRDWLCNDRS